MTIPTTPGRLGYTAREVAAMLGVPLSTVLMRIRRGELRSTRIGKHHIVSATELDRLLNGGAAA